jgi:hypothetical protein
VAKWVRITEADLVLDANGEAVPGFEALANPRKKLYVDAPTQAKAEAYLKKERWVDFYFLGSGVDPDKGPVLVFRAPMWQERDGIPGQHYWQLAVGTLHPSMRYERGSSLQINYRRIMKDAKKNCGARRNPRQADVNLYQHLLGHLRAIQWAYTTTHWSTSGAGFYGNHLLLQRLYEGLNDPIDQLGERMVAYFGPESVNPDLIQGLSHKIVTAFTRQGASPAFKLLLLEESLQAAIRKAWAANKGSGKAMSLGLDDWLMGLANSRDEAIYLLKQSQVT